MKRGRRHHLFALAFVCAACVLPGTPSPARGQATPSPLAYLKPIDSGPGIVVTAPTASEPSLADFGAGCSLWIQYHLADYPAFGKMPALSAIYARRDEMKRANLRLSAADAGALAATIGATHFLIGEIAGTPRNASLVYHVETAAGKAIAAPLTAAGSEEEILQALPQLVQRVAAALGAPNPEPAAKSSLTAREVETLGRFSWSSIPDPSPTELRSMSAIGARDPLGALMALRYFRYLPARDLSLLTRRIDQAAADNPLPFAETLLHGALPAPERVGAAKQLVTRFPTSALANLVYARTLRKGGSFEEELKITETAVRCAPGAAQYWLSLGHVFSQQAESLRRGRTSGDITQEEWRTLEDLYANWLHAIGRAVGIDDKSAHAFSDLAMAATFAAERNIAFDAYDSAMEIDPNSYEAMVWGLQMFQPKWLDDEKRLRRVADQVMRADFASGDEAGAMVQRFQEFGIPSAPLVERFQARAKANIAKAPDHPANYYTLALFDQATERYGEAALLYEKMLALGCTQYDYLATARMMYLLAGQKDRAQRVAAVYGKAVEAGAAITGAAPAAPVAAAQAKAAVPGNAAPAAAGKLNGVPAVSGSGRQALGGPTPPTGPLKGAAPPKPAAPLDPAQDRLDSAFSHYQRAVIFGQQSQFPDAAKEMREAIRLSPKNAGYHTYLGEYLAAAGKRDDAMAEMRVGAKMDATDTALAQLYQLLRGMGKMGDAADALLAAGPKQRKAAFIYLEAAEMRLQAGRLDDAAKLADLGIEAVESGASISRDVPRAYVVKGDVLLKQGNKSAAIACWKKGAESPFKDDFFTEQLKVRLTQNGAGGAVTVAAPSGQTNPGAASVHYQMWRDFYAKKEYKAAEEELRAALRLNPNNPEYHNDLSNWLLQTGRKDESLAELRKAAEVNESDWDVYNLYDRLRTQPGVGKEEALGAARLGLKKQKHESIPLSVVLGRDYLDKGALADAKKMVATARDIQKGPRAVAFFSPDIDLLEGDILWKQGRGTEARAAWQNAADYPQSQLQPVKDAKQRLADHKDDAPPQP
jgi:tetratricopeptide (TPR) repeat protein